MGILRSDIKVGDFVKTCNSIDNLDLNNQIGEIIFMKDYGRVLIQYLIPFSNLLHSGDKNMGKPNSCFYINLNNIKEILPPNISIKLKNKEILPYQISLDLNKIFRKMLFNPTEEFLDVSFLDINENKDKMEMITYLSAKKYTGEPDMKKGRQSMRIGRMLKKLKPNLTDVQVQDYVAKYLAAYRLIILKEGLRVEVVTGEDIRYWYSDENYYYEPDSSLWKSCMRDPSDSDRFDIYCENTEKVGLCIYKNEDNELLARALVWNLDDGNTYMDRIYSVSDDCENVLRDYAENLDMLSYYRWIGNNFLKVSVKRDYTVMNDLDDEYDDDDDYRQKEEVRNPYMDTFKFLVVTNDNKYYICNRHPIESIKKIQDIYQG